MRYNIGLTSTIVENQKMFEMILKYILRRNLYVLEMYV